GYGNRGSTRVAAGCEADVVELAALTECSVHERRIQGRNLGAVVDHGAFAAAAHFDDVSIGNLVPLQSRADQFDTDLVEDAVFSLFNRLAWNIFKSHPRGVERELFSDPGCHVSFPLPLQRFYARFAFANSAALAPAKRPKTAPF